MYEQYVGHHSGRLFKLQLISEDSGHFPPSKEHHGCWSAIVPIVIQFWNRHILIENALHSLKGSDKYTPHESNESRLLHLLSACDVMVLPLRYD